MLPKASAQRRRGIRLGCTFHATSKAAAERLGARLRRAGCTVAIFRAKDQRSWYVLSNERRFRALTVASINAWIARMAAAAAQAKATFRGWSFRRRRAA